MANPKAEGHNLQCWKLFLQFMLVEDLTRLCLHSPKVKSRLRPLTCLLHPSNVIFSVF